MTSIQRKELADDIARKCQDHPRNQANPHAYGRAHMMFMNGQLSEDDFKKSDYAPGDVC